MQEDNKQKKQQLHKIWFELVLLVTTLIVVTIVFVGRGRFVSTFLNLKGDHIVVAQAGGAPKLSGYGTVCVKTDDLDGSNGRSSLQTEASIVCQPQETLAAGDYYIHLQGHTGDETVHSGGALKVLIGNQKKTCILSNEEMEYYFYLNLSEPATELYMSWSNDQSMPVISDFQVVKLVEGTDVSALKQGAFHPNATVKNASLTQEQSLCELATDMVAAGTTLYYATDKSIYAYDAATQKSKPQLVATMSNPVLQLQYDSQNSELIALLESGVATVSTKNGAIAELGGYHFKGAVNELTIAGNLWFAVEGEAGLEIFSRKGSTLTRLSALPEQYDFALQSAVCVDDYLYISAGSRILIYAVADPAHPYYMGRITTAGVVGTMEAKDEKLYVATQHDDVTSARGYEGAPGYGSGYGLLVYDITQRDLPVVIDGWRMDGLGNKSSGRVGIKTEGNRVYLSLKEYGIHALTFGYDGVADTDTLIRLKAHPKAKLTKIVSCNGKLFVMAHGLGIFEMQYTKED